MSQRPRLLLADPEPATRLLVLDALREAYEVQPIEEGEDPLRTTRKLRPAALLLAVPSRQTQAAIRACRSLKTEASPPRVLLLDLSGRLADPKAAREESLADGVLSGRVTAEQIRAFLAAALAGDRPVTEGERGGRGLLSRLLGR